MWVNSNQNVHERAPEIREAANVISAAARNLMTTLELGSEARRRCKAIIKEVANLTNRLGTDAVETSLTSNLETLDHPAKNADINFTLVALLLAAVLIVKRREPWGQETVEVLCIAALFYAVYFYIHSHVSIADTTTPIASVFPRTVPVSATPCAPVTHVTQIAPVDAPVCPAPDVSSHSANTLVPPPKRTRESPNGEPSRPILGAGTIFTAPTQRSPEWAPYKVLMNQHTAYHPHTQDPSTKLENCYTAYVAMDLQSTYWIDQFHLESRQDGYVKTFEIHYKVNSADEYTVLIPDSTELNSPQLFAGLCHHSEQRTYKNFLPFVARYVKIVPRTFQEVPVIKFEIYGVEVSPPAAPVVSAPLVRASTSSADRQVKRHQVPSLPLLDKLPRSSFYAPNEHRSMEWGAHRIALSQRNAYHPHDFAPIYHAFVTIDLERVHWIDRFQLESRKDSANQFVQSFEIHFKVNSTDEYTLLAPDSAPSAQFQGLNHHLEVKTYENFLPFVARYVKIVPRTFYVNAVMKLELFGAVWDTLL
uniref:F5/8 type C domain-containing protein n=1 Tax=Spumella elongata TaxID=89044 RepID=A0A7S3LZW1_9STRA